MPIIKKLNINGFKSIWQDTLDLGQLNVFIGTNGAGKSNLLEAIAMVSASLEGGIDYEKLQRRGARLSSSEIFRSAFRNLDRRSTFKLAVELGDLAYSMSINAEGGFRYFAESVRENGKVIAGRSNNGSTLRGTSLKSRLNNKKGIYPYLKTFQAIVSPDSDSDSDALQPLNSLMDFAIFAPTTPILRGIETDSSAKEPLGLYGGRLADALFDIIEEHMISKKTELPRFFELLDWVHSFTTTKESDPELLSGQINIAGRKIRYKDKFMKMSFNKLYAYDVSEGALYVLFILVLLSHKRAPNIFALDNIDTALNPGLVRGLMSQVSSILKRYPDKQVFLTTHNPSALDSVDLFDPDHRLFIVERDKNGHTKSRRVMPPENMTKSQWEEKYFGMRLSEIWLSGAIGGLAKGF